MTICFGSSTLHFSVHTIFKTKDKFARKQHPCMRLSMLDTAMQKNIKMRGLLFKLHSRSFHCNIHTYSHKMHHLSGFCVT